MEKKFIIYRIFYGEKLIAYVGQTTQDLKDRMYQHFFKDVDLDFSSVKKIDYAYCNSNADMNVYETYYINKMHPFENRLGISNDKLTIVLPELNFELFNISILEKYKKNDKIFLNRSTKLPKTSLEIVQKNIDRI